MMNDEQPKKDNRWDKVVKEGKETYDETTKSVSGMEKHEKKAMWVVAACVVAATAIAYCLVRLLT